MMELRGKTSGAPIGIGTIRQILGKQVLGRFQSARGGEPMVGDEAIGTYH